MRLKGRLKTIVLEHVKKKLFEIAAVSGVIEIDDLSITEHTIPQTLRILQQNKCKPTLENIKEGTVYHSLLILGQIRMMSVWNKDDPKQGPLLIKESRKLIHNWVNKLKGDNNGNRL